MEKLGNAGAMQCKFTEFSHGISKFALTITGLTYWLHTGMSLDISNSRTVPLQRKTPETKRHGKACQQIAVPRTGKLFNPIEGVKFPSSYGSLKLEHEKG